MDKELDPNAIAADIITTAFSSAVSTAKSAILRSLNKLKGNDIFAKYISKVLSKCATCKSFLQRDENIPLYNIYHPLDLQAPGVHVKSAGIDEVLRINNFCSIIGSGGSGKSMMMKHLLLDTIKKRKGIPVFIEMRKLEFADFNIINMIRDELKVNKIDFDDASVEELCEKGKFTLLLDGYDEVPHKYRKKVFKYTNEFAGKYNLNSIIVSSRPDDEITCWNNFKTLQVCPLTLEQACMLMNKVRFNEVTKSRFVENLKKTLYEKHKSFTSNPLLLSIMLLTYSETAEIPTKMSIFYAHAYEVLFNRHDALKENYTREHYTKLDIEDFARVFSAFSLLSIMDRVFSFTQALALKYIKAAIEASGISCNQRDFLNDAIKSTCLLVQDGINIAFAHRSFQEYFSARYICYASPDDKQELVEEVGQNTRDNTVMLLHEMDKVSVEKYHIIPRIRSVAAKCKVGPHFTDNDYKAFLKVLIASFEFDQRGRLEKTFLSGTVDIYDLYYLCVKRYAVSNVKFADKTQVCVASGLQGLEQFKCIEGSQEVYRLTILEALKNADVYNAISHKNSFISYERVKMFLLLPGVIEQAHARTSTSIKRKLKGLKRQS